MTMSSPRLRRTADVLFDQCAKELAALAVAINNKESPTDVRATLTSVSHRHAVNLHQLIGDPVSSEGLRKQLLTRSNDEISGFADTLPRQSIESSLLNETLEPVSNGGVIAFLKVKRLH